MDAFYEYFNAYTLVTFVTAFISYYVYLKLKNRIPGPYCLPFVGYLPFLGNNPHETFTQLANKYGNIFRVQLGTVDIVFLNDLHCIKEAFSKEELLARPEETVFTAYITDVSFGLLEGHEWIEQRRFAMRTLKELGFAKAAMEDHITESIEEFCVNVDHENGEPKKLLSMLHASTLNILLAYFTGKRLNFNDKQMTEIVEAAFSNDTSATIVDLSAFFPFLAKIFAKFELFGFKGYKNFVQTALKFSEKRVEEVENDAEERNRGTSFIALFLDEIEKAAKSNSKTTFTRERLVDTIYDFILASTDTIGTQVAWIVMCAAKFPHWQKRVQNEVDSVVGNDRLAHMTDRKNLIETQAFLLEVQRYISFMPINLPRRTLKKITLQGIQIPANTQILANFYAVNKDEKLWENVDEFKPERFISDDGKRIVNTEKMLTFSFGKRSCPGEVLATAELFLYTTHLLQKYNIETVDGSLPSMEHITGITLRPKVMNLKFVKRK